MFTMGIFSCNNLDRSSRLGNSMEGDVCQIMLPNSLHYPERYKFVVSTFLEILSLKFEILDMKFVVFGWVFPLNFVMTISIFFSIILSLVEFLIQVLMFNFLHSRLWAHCLALYIISISACILLYFVRMPFLINSHLCLSIFCYLENMQEN